MHKQNLKEAQLLLELSFFSQNEALVDLSVKWPLNKPFFLGGHVFCVRFALKLR